MVHEVINDGIDYSEFTDEQLNQLDTARRRPHEFVVQAWHVLEPETLFVDGLHVHAVRAGARINEGATRQLRPTCQQQATRRLEDSGALLESHRSQRS
jgi:hypothetical protein